MVPSTKTAYSLCLRSHGTGRNRQGAGRRISSFNGRDPKIFRRQRHHSSIQKDGNSVNAYPKGFYVYNYASQGIYRYNKKMVSLKGFTQNIWGSEIYAWDNRFGRYQSYGSMQIIGTPTPEALNNEYPITEEASRYKEAGWDWNRNPGTTTIHLPLELLNSPFKGSDMLLQPESFAGASQLNNGEFGMFAMKLGERDRKNFTPSFNAHKSVFAFETESSPQDLLSGMTTGNIRPKQHSSSSTCLQ